MDALIDKLYSNTDEIRKAYENSGNLILLQDFLDKESYASIMEGLKKSKWKGEKIPDKHSYSTLKNENIENIFYGMNAFFSKVTGKNKISELKVMRFGHRDYTLIHDLESRDETQFFFFSFDSWKNEWGGSIVYSDEEGNPIIFPPLKNGLGIIDKGKGINNFVKYVNCMAEDNCLFLITGVLK